MVKQTQKWIFPLNFEIRLKRYLDTFLHHLPNLTYPVFRNIERTLPKSSILRNFLINPIIILPIQPLGFYFSTINEHFRLDDKLKNFSLQAGHNKVKFKKKLPLE